MDSHARAHPKIDLCSCTNGLNLCNTFLAQNVRYPATFLLSNHHCDRAKPPNSVSADVLDASRRATTVLHVATPHRLSCGEFTLRAAKQRAKTSPVCVASQAISICFFEWVASEEGEYTASDGWHATQHGVDHQADSASGNVHLVVRPEPSQHASEGLRQVA